MNPVHKLNLQDKLKEMDSDLDADVIYRVLTALDKLRVLPDVWSVDPHVINEKIGNTLPKTISIVTPMWGGIVYLIKKDNYFAYQDENNNVRIYDKTEKGLAKKLNKYKK